MLCLLIPLSSAISLWWLRLLQLEFWNHMSFLLFLINTFSLSETTAFTKSLETPNCRSGIKTFCTFYNKCFFQTLGNTARYHCVKYRIVICTGDHVRCCYVREHCVSKMAPTWCDDDENLVGHNTFMLIGVWTLHNDREILKENKTGIYCTNCDRVLNRPYVSCSD